MTTITLSHRRQQMAQEILGVHKEGTRRSAEFDYRRRIVDDVEKILRDADVFRPTRLRWTLDDADRADQDAKLREVAEAIASYIMR